MSFNLFLYQKIKIKNKNTNKQTTVASKNTVHSSIIKLPQSLYHHSDSWGFPEDALIHIYRS